jgi:hypothetical protein
MRALIFTTLVTLAASQAFAQAPSSVESSVATPTGFDVSAGVSSYSYREPGDQAIQIHAPKFVAEGTGTFLLSKQHHWFAQGQFSGTTGNTTYNGWCSPFEINPNSASPNGYELDIGDATPCNESGDRDWYIEGRGLVGKDLLTQKWGWSPYTGMGLRYLSNGTTGTPGYRTDRYLYIPAGLTAHTNLGAHRPLSLNVEFDAMLHGWQNTHDSMLGGGDVPGTPTAPPFTVDGFTDISFSQPGGWAVRASAKVPVTRIIFLEPYYVRWDVKSSPVNYETATFTVNGISAQEQLGAYEPHNTTNEFGLKFGLHF